MAKIVTLSWRTWDFWVQEYSLHSHEWGINLLSVFFFFFIIKSMDLQSKEFFFISPRFELYFNGRKSIQDLSTLNITSVEHFAFIFFLIIFFYLYYSRYEKVCSKTFKVSKLWRIIVIIISNLWYRISVWKFLRVQMFMFRLCFKWISRQLEIFQKN